MNSNHAVELNLTKLPPYQPRTFVPENIDLTDKDQVLGLLQKLLDRTINSSEELERWLMDMSEFDAAFGQVYSVLHIRMTCQTDDESRRRRFEIRRKCRTGGQAHRDQINRKYLKERERSRSMKPIQGLRPGHPRRRRTFPRRKRAPPDPGIAVKPGIPDSLRRYDGRISGQGTDIAANGEIPGRTRSPLARIGVESDDETTITGQRQTRRNFR